MPKLASTVLRIASPASYRRASGITCHAARTQRIYTSARRVALLRHERNGGWQVPFAKPLPANHRCTFGIMPSNNDFRVQLFARPPLCDFAQLCQNRQAPFSEMLPPRTTAAFPESCARRFPRPARILRADLNTSLRRWVYSVMPKIDKHRSENRFPRELPPRFRNPTPCSPHPAQLHECALCCFAPP